LGFFYVFRPLGAEPRPYTHVALFGTQEHTMITSGSDRTGGISRNSALRRRWHPETKVIGEGQPLDEPAVGFGNGEDEIQRPPQRALALRVKFLDPGKID
jgi:hypothetical protein